MNKSNAIIYWWRWYNVVGIKAYTGVGCVKTSGNCIFENAGVANFPHELKFQLFSQNLTANLLKCYNIIRELKKLYYSLLQGDLYDKNPYRLFLR